MAALIRRSPFVYPGGQARLAQGHPAVNGALRLACYATAGGNMFDLLTNKAGVIVGAPAGDVNSIGPTAYAPTTGANYCEWPAVVPAESLTQWTMAAIFQPRGSSGGQGFVTPSQSSGNTQISVQSTGQIAFVNSSVLFAGIWPVAIPGHNYFAVVSYRNFGAQPKSNGVLVDLTTGQKWIAGVTTGTVSQGVGTFYSTISYAGGTLDHGRLAAAMISAQALTPQQMLAWSGDPWSLWYARSPQIIRDSGIKTSTLAPGAVQGRVLVEVTGRAGPTGRLNLFG